MPVFVADDFYVNDPTDQTKSIRLDVSAIATSTIRVRRKQNQSASEVIVGDGTTNAQGEIEKINFTAQNTSITGQLLNTSSLAGYYVVHYTLSCTTADVTAGTVAFSISYTDDVGAFNPSSAARPLTGTGRTTGTFEMYQASGNASYAATITGLAGASFYALRVRVEYLGP